AADPEKCVHCHVCSRNCPMSLPVESMVLQNIMENSECILCGSCIDDCGSGSIEYAFRGRR
ncbi:4Fe-4S dicluster domain-containing protein, partial [Gemmatimonadota bacterium]